MKQNKVAVVFSESSQAKLAKVAGKQLDLPVLTLLAAEKKDFDFFLFVEAEGFSLREAFLSKNKKKAEALKIEFGSGPLDYRRRFGQNGGDLIIKAVGGGRNHRNSSNSSAQVLDLTLGLGRDAFILASHGWMITGIEQSPVLCEMLTDARDRALKNPRIEKVVKRIKIINEDSSSFLNNLESYEKKSWDVILFDPMFPTKKKSALPKKEMQILHAFIGADDDETESQKIADFVIKKKICSRLVVKRPLLAPPLVQSKKASLTFKSSSTRFDVYFIEKT
jgi:16S rRNA (guanine1516-N2)-methyltransferase